MRRLECLLLCLLLTLFPLAAMGESVETASIIARVITEKGPLKLRERPERGKKVLCQIPNGDLVLVLSCEDGWWQITWDDNTGWAMADYLTICEGLDVSSLSMRTLRVGDSGEDVLSLKQRLMELGYLRTGSTLTNVFGKTLEERLLMFERQNGLEEDGIATPELQQLLFSDAAAVNKEPLPAPAVSHITQTSGTTTQSEGGHQVICGCCLGEGCECCNGTGWTWVAD